MNLIKVWILLICIFQMTFCLEIMWADGPDIAQQQPSLASKFTKFQNEPNQRQRGIGWSVNNKFTQASNFYLFGGFRYQEFYLNDFWKYTVTNTTPANGTWEFLGSRSSKNGVYGKLGVGSPDNWPGARENAASWVDTHGNLYLFGGKGIDGAGSEGLLNDLWRFDGSVWTWINGDNSTNQPGFYLLRDGYHPLHKPGARSVAGSWSDSLGYGYIFGGFGYGMAPAVQNMLGDFWKYDSTLNVWGWFGGQPSNQYQPGVYGTKGVPNKANHPGSRERPCAFIGHQGETIWMFGGLEMPNDKYRLMNDLWSYNGINWTWMSGSQAPEQLSNYGQMGLAAETNVVGARENLVCWADSEGGVWLFGGSGRGSSINGKLNDIWFFNQLNGLWTWAGGTSRVNDYGSFEKRYQFGGLPSARESSTGFLDYTGNFWLFGGVGYDKERNEGNLGDVWKIINPGIPPEPFKLTNELVIAFVAVFILILMVSSLGLCGCSSLYLRSLQQKRMQIQNDSEYYEAIPN